MNRCVDCGLKEKVGLRSVYDVTLCTSCAKLRREAEAEAERAIADVYGFDDPQAEAA